MYDRHPGDDLLKDDPRLKRDWGWSRMAADIPKSERDKWTHFQVSECRLGMWTLEAVQWGHPIVYYESRIRYNKQSMASIGNDLETGAETRLEAQMRAEGLLRDWITKEYTFVLGD